MAKINQESPKERKHETDQIGAEYILSLGRAFVLSCFRDSLFILRNGTLAWAVLILWGTARVQAEPPLVQIQHVGPVQAVAWSADGKTLASAGDHGTIHFTAFPSGKEINRLETKTPLSGLVISPDGKVVGVKVALDSGPLCVWNIAAKKQLRKLAFPSYSAHHLAFTADGGTLVAVGPGQHMIWNHIKGGGYGSRQGQVPAGSFAAAAPNGQVVAWSNPQGFVQMHYTDQRRFHRLQIGPAQSMAFSPDAQLLASGHNDKTVRLWEVASGKEVKKFEGLREPATRLTFSGNGKVLAAAFLQDPVVRLWDVASGRLRRRLTVNPSAVQAMALSPDGRALALASGDKVLVWNVATRELGNLGPPVALAKAELETAWSDLANNDYGKAETAFRKLAAAGNHALAFLQHQVRAVAVPALDWQRVEKLLRDLDDSSYPVRQKATLELGQYGELIRVPLEKYLAGKLSLEALRRAGKLLDKVKEPPLTPDRLRSLEAIEILEILRTPEARRLLEELSRDSLIAQIRLAAQEALERVQRTPKGKSGGDKAK